ncbi:MAG: hypothetical protein IKU58_02205 [Clostridia bacterium]|nr:hypothetical protein [Clostridia bacterium]
MRKFATWGAALLALVCAFGLGRGGNAYSETDLALAREEAYNSGYHAGYAQGEAAAQESVYTEGFSAGRLQGYDEGLAEGSRQAQSAAVEQASSLLTFTPLPVDDPAPDRSTPVVEEPVGQVVYVTKSGTKYHLGSCSHLSKSKIEKSLADAKAAGYEPCKTCDPPK